MMQVFICGQAPSRVGDGRPFSGPSGNRLAALLGLRDYEHLAASMYLVNIFSEPAESLGDRGDAFDREAARSRGLQYVEEWKSTEARTIVIACGHGVYHALTGLRGTFYRGRRMGSLEVWCFPHPSGASAYWNSRENVEKARAFLLKLLDRSGITIAQ